MTETTKDNETVTVNRKQHNEMSDAHYRLMRVYEDLREMLPKLELSEAIADTIRRPKNDKERKQNLAELMAVLDDFADVFGISQYKPEQRKEISARLAKLALEAMSGAEVES